MITHRHFLSPIGRLLLGADDTHLREIWFEQSRYPRPDESTLTIGDNRVLRSTVTQLQAYFRGELQCFDLPLNPRGTPFQRSVWSALNDIAFGSTASYREIAQQLGMPTATRAVGAANGRNPIPIVIPCHRVIGANGALTGFGGGLPVKDYLLRLEGVKNRSEDLFSH